MMNDDFIFEKIPHSREKRAGARIAKGAKNISIGTAIFDNVDNAMVFEGDAEEVNIGSMVINNGENPFHMNNLVNSQINNVEINNSEILNKTRAKFKEELGKTKSDSEKAALMGDHAMFLKTHLIYDESFDWLKKSLIIYKEVQDTVGISLCYGNIGVLFKSMGYLDKAIKCYNLALELDDKENRIIGVVTNYINIGIAYDLMEEVDKAIDIYMRCIGVAKQGLSKEDLPEYLGKIYSNLAISLEKKDKDKAIKIYGDSIALNIENQNWYFLAFDYRNLGRFYQKLEETKLSTDLILKSADLFKEIGNLREYNRTKALLNIKF